MGPAADFWAQALLGQLQITCSASGFRTCCLVWFRPCMPQGLSSQAQPQPAPLACGGPQTGPDVRESHSCCDAIPESILTAPERACQPGGGSEGHRTWRGSPHRAMPPPGDGPLTAQSRLEASCFWAVWFVFSANSVPRVALCVSRTPVQTGKFACAAPQYFSLERQPSGQCRRLTGGCLCWPRLPRKSAATWGPF